MQLTEKHIINYNHAFYKTCDDLCFKSKNIYNLSLYRINEDLKQDSYNALNNLFHVMKVEDCFKELPMKVATATIIAVQKNIKSYFKSVKDYSKHPEKYKGKPKFPHYLHKTKGRFLISYSYQAVSKKVFKAAHKIKLSGVDIEFYTKVESFDQIDCVRIVPQSGQFTIEVVYTVPDVDLKKDNKHYLSIDLGVNNLAAITSNKAGFKPILINGKPLKSINQYYNKKLSKIVSVIETRNKSKVSKATKALTNKRTNKIDDYLHKASKMVVEIAKANDINTVVIGCNKQWKQEINIGKENNQKFAMIPHSRFVDMIRYKCEKEGIRLVLQEESYTSLSSFLNGDYIPIYKNGDDSKYIFSGYRKHRGLYKIKGEKTIINADVNGSYNILRKAFPKAFNNGIEGVVVHPSLVNVPV